MTDYCRRLLAVAGATTALWLPPSLATAQDPVDGTVFVRLVGNLQALRGDDARLRREVLVELTDVPLATGSGFIVSPDGLAVTNLHVVTGETRVVTIRGEKVEVTVDVQRIEVLVPGNTGDPALRLYPASIAASDAELDLAVLYLNALDLPYVRLGDSDALASGAAVRALGYPFGEALEIGKLDAAPDAIPNLTVSPGAVSSIRRDAGGDVRYVQTTAPLNPGNSGGPIVDEDGYAVAVAQLELRDSAGRSGVGFGVPVNKVKEFLYRNGLGQRLPARMLTLAGYLEAPAKGIRLLAPYGFTDRSPFRLRVDSAASDPAVVLRIDRLATAQSLDRIERAVVNDGALDGVRASSPLRSRSRTGSVRPGIDGVARSRDGASGQDLAIEYSIIGLGDEVIVARYIGVADAVAINRSVLRASLASVEAHTLVVGGAKWGAPTTWMPIAVGGTQTSLVIPEGWVVESGAPSPCRGVEAPAWSVTASPVGDFTVQLRAAWRPGATIDLAQAARACAPRAGASGAASYVSTTDWWGTAYPVEGVFAAVPTGVWHLEVVAPAARSTQASQLFRAWVTAIVGPP